jgi:hypothetical protein
MTGDIPGPHGSATIFEAMNHDKLFAMMQMFEKGVLEDGPMPKVKVPGLGPDPDPSAMSTAAIAAMNSVATSQVSTADTSAVATIPGDVGNMGGNMGGNGGGGGYNP